MDEMPDLQQGLDGYRHNILELIHLAKEHHVHLLFMTQPSLVKPNMSQEEIDRIWAGHLGNPVLNAYWSIRVRSIISAAYNRLVLETCREKGIDCIDLASNLPRTPAVFWDHGHFTDYGSSLVADELVRYFNDYFGKTKE
ncbi:MAG: hypothetical protein EHM28_15405 [Spirochaetaceae bacterium]|nr:MAG: hypothetical protein EHM28_15405 [Spirochaetaceae bacterium]